MNETEMEKVDNNNNTTNTNNTITTTQNTNQEEFYDVILIGTGLIQSILASALSRVGIKILHIDTNDRYGDLDSVLSLDGLMDWTRDVTKRQQNNNNKKKKDDNDDDDEEEDEEKKDEKNENGSSSIHLHSQLYPSLRILSTSYTNTTTQNDDDDNDKKNSTTNTPLSSSSSSSSSIPLLKKNIEVFVLFYRM